MEWYQVLMIILSTSGISWMIFNNLGNRIDRLSDDIKREMRDFHGRLERIDAEFNGRFERQDAEFKGWVRLMDEKYHKSEKK